MLSSDQRLSFIDHFWERYPSCLSGPSFSFCLQGRLFGFSKTSHSGKIGEHSVNFSEAQMIALTEVPVFEASDVLSEHDIIQVFGHFENSIFVADQVLLLAPCLQLRNVPSLSLFEQRDDFLHAVSQFFRDRGFISVVTPHLLSSLAVEPHIDLFETSFRMGHEVQNLFLPTSPELHLKKSLSFGVERAFEIKSCFRNGELTSLHEPEFLMLEWYRAYEDLHQLQKDIEELLSFLLEKYNLPKKQSPFRIESCASLFKTFFNFSLAPDTTKIDLQRLARQQNIYFHEEDSWDDLFHRLYVEKIEIHLPKEPFFLVDYPASQAALAKINSRGWAERFEFYWQGVELANAYNELNDPFQQKARFEKDLKVKQELKKTLTPIDEEFIGCLEQGMPPSSGVALGLDRLFMLLFGYETLATSKPFYFKRPI